MSMTSDLALAADPGFLDRAEDPAGFILQACKQAIEWFAQAPGYEGIDEIVRVRADAAAALAYARQAKLGLDTALIVAEASRRADRALGLAIRAGQQAGAVYGYKRGRVSPQRGDGTLVRFVREFAPASDLAPGGGQPGIYDFTDGVTSEQFEQAITASRDEGNLSRKNLARKIADAAADQTRPTGFPGRATAPRAPQPAAARSSATRPGRGTRRGRSAPPSASTTSTCGAWPATPASASPPTRRSAGPAPSTRPASSRRPSCPSKHS